MSKVKSKSRPKARLVSRSKPTSKSRFSTAVKNDIQMLKFLRDEAALQAHLFKADFSDRWDQLEKKWQSLQVHVERAGVAAGDARREVNAARAQLANSLKQGYAQVKQALNS